MYFRALKWHQIYSPYTDKQLVINCKYTTKVSTHDFNLITNVKLCIICQSAISSDILKLQHNKRKKSGRQIEKKRRKQGRKRAAMESFIVKKIERKRFLLSYGQKTNCDKRKTASANNNIMDNRFAGVVIVSCFGYGIFSYLWFRIFCCRFLLIIIIKCTENCEMVFRKAPIPLISFSLNARSSPNSFSTHANNIFVLVNGTIVRKIPFQIYFDKLAGF